MLEMENRDASGEGRKERRRGAEGEKEGNKARSRGSLRYRSRAESANPRYLSSERVPRRRAARRVLTGSGVTSNRLCAPMSLGDRGWW